MHSPKVINLLPQLSPAFWFCSVEIASNGKWLAIGIQSQIWILSLEWGNNFQIINVEHFATFEGHREPVSNLHFIESGFDTRLISASHDRTFNVWSVPKLECMYESPLLGHYRYVLFLSKPILNPTYLSSFHFQSYVQLPLSWSKVESDPCFGKLWRKTILFWTQWYSRSMFCHQSGWNDHEPSSKQ